MKVVITVYLSDDFEAPRNAREVSDLFYSIDGGELGWSRGFLQAAYSIAVDGGVPVNGNGVPQERVDESDDGEDDDDIDPGMAPDAFYAMAD